MMFLLFLTFKIV